MESSFYYCCSIGIIHLSVYLFIRLGQDATLFQVLSGNYRRRIWLAAAATTATMTP
jgi:hypothetical protein